LQSHTTYTCGEDGHIRAWKLAGEDETMQFGDETESTMKKLKSGKEKRKEKKEKRKHDGDDEARKARYKPY
jgi:hypothetical protein